MVALRLTGDTTAPYSPARPNSHFKTLKLVRLPRFAAYDPSFHSQRASIGGRLLDVMLASVIAGRQRRGGQSVADVLVEILWGPSRAQRPAHRIQDLQAQASKRLGYLVPASTIRSTIYNHPEAFEREGPEGPGVLWRLTDTVWGQR